MDFFKSFKEMEFDFISNMVKWSEKNNCFDKIKPILDKVISRINNNYYDHFSGKFIFDHKEEIRDTFKSMHRDIQISRIL